MTFAGQNPVRIPSRLRDSALFRPAENVTFGNPDFAVASARVLILRLSPWRDVASSTPHLFLAQTVRHAIPKSYIDFAFLPLAGDRRLLREAGLPLALGIQSRRGIADFDLVLVSNSFVLEAINLPSLLQDAGFSPWSDERTEDAPTVILGGSNAFAAHCLVRPDGVGVPDAFFFGEGEGSLMPILQAWQAAAGQPKRERLRQAAAAADGLWVADGMPDVFAWEGRADIPVRQAVARDAAIPDVAGYPLLNGETADTVRLQAARGCPAFCSFCFEGFERKPYREIPADLLLAQARRLKVATGARCVELDAYTLNLHSEVGRLIDGLSRLFDRVSFKSQRVDVLAEQPELMHLECAAGKRSFTLGIEGISKRLRDFLNKSINESQIERVVRSMLTANVREIKFFYLITGYETTADLAAFGAFTRQLDSWMEGPRRTTRLVFSFGYLVRMPNTPLRYDRLFLDRAPLERIAHELEHMCRRYEFEFRLASTWDEYLATQLLVAGGYRLAPLVVSMATDVWFYDGELPTGYAHRLRQGLAEAGGLDATVTEPKARDRRFPFGFVATTVSPAFLYRQYEAVRRHRDRGYCLGGTCLLCGACRDKTERQALTRRTRAPAIAVHAAAEVDRLVRAKQRLQPTYCRVRLGSGFAWTTAEWSSARLTQLLLAAMPEETDNLLVAEEALFSTSANRERFPIPAGETVVGLKTWDVKRLAKRLTGLTSGEIGLAIATCDCAIGAVLPAFVPGSFVSATWQVASEWSAVEIERAVAHGLREAHLPFSLRRTSEGARFELAPAAQRKNVVLDAGVRTQDGRGIFEGVLTSKADLLGLLGRLATTRGMDDLGWICTHLAVG